MATKRGNRQLQATEVLINGDAFDPDETLPVAADKRHSLLKQKTEDKGLFFK